MALFLVWHEEEAAIDPETLFALDSFQLRSGLLLVASDLSVSRLYHQIKWALPLKTALLVTRIEGMPKFKLMEEGALSWTRSRATRN